MSRCSIILVHGTWGRGFFPKRREVSLLPPNKRWWFEEGSQFHAGLDTALKSASLDWPIRAFLWSGANSVHDRDCAARELSQQLRKDLQDPDATAVIIAHSHGGNVALRALQHLGSTPNRVRVVTLATPFLRVFARKSFQLPAVLSVAIVLFLVFGLPVVLAPYVEARGLLFFVGLLICALLLGILGSIVSNTSAALAIEEKANYDTKDAAASRMLVIRGVDDEASLSLAAGMVGSRLTYFVLVVALPMLFPMTFILLTLIWFTSNLDDIWVIRIFESFGLCALIFLFVPGAFKSAFGREFLVSGLVCHIVAESVPDTLGQLEAITLRPIEAEKSVWLSIASGKPPESEWETYMSGIEFWHGPWFHGGARLIKPSWQLRHRIYNHPDCVDEIVRWLRRVT
jgi:hypothetical protein